LHSMCPWSPASSQFCDLNAWTRSCKLICLYKFRYECSAMLLFIFFTSTLLAWPFYVALSYWTGQEHYDVKSHLDRSR
jgi:hypothetical protein